MMKSFLNLSIAASVLIIAPGCAKTLLPKDQLSVNTTFVSYDGFRTYAWKFYSVFPGYDGSAPNSEFNGDLF
ncbi:hypothetical protein KRR40_30585 [Niabella defluvii]|nr:hypothetical protein KRR40_30585 [Niabella sp. I65]